jgi:integrase
MTKRANGRGSVEVLPDGRARIRAVIAGKRRQVGPLYPDEATALRMLAAWNDRRDAGLIEAPSEVTLASLGATWLDRRELNGSKKRAVVRSIAQERSVWRSHVEPSELAKLPIDTIEPADIEAFTYWLRGRTAVQATVSGFGSARTTVRSPTKRPLSRAMQREALRLVRSVLSQAVRDQVIAVNPADEIGVAAGGPRAKDLSEDWLRQDEIEKLLACDVISLRDRTAFACAIGLALRLNDLKAIEVSHVDINARVPGPHVRVWLAKPEKWHRVPVMPWLVPWLRAHLATLPRHAKWLFPREDGAAYGKDYKFSWPEKRERVQRVVGKVKQRVLVRTPSALERAGVNRRIRFHDLRGTCATHLALGTWGRTWSMHEVQSMLAHSDQRVTERYVRRALDPTAAAAAATPGCPGLPMNLSGTSAKSAVKSGAPGAGLEPATIRLTASPSPKSSRDVDGPHGQRVGNANPRELAEHMIAASERREMSWEMLEGLADAVLGTPEARLAMVIRERGPHAVRAGVELAGLILKKTRRKRREEVSS